MPRQPPCALDDSSAMAVLGDWLAERGDPRGELIHLQLAREVVDQASSGPGPRASSGRLLAAEARHLALHAKALLGPLALHQSVAELTWRRGYVVEAVLRSQVFAWRTDDTRNVVEPANRLARAVRDLGRLPAREHLRRLRLVQPWSSVLIPQMRESLRALRATDLALDELAIVTPETEDEWDLPVAVWEEPSPKEELELDGVRVRCDERMVEVVGLVLR